MPTTKVPIHDNDDSFSNCDYEQAVNAITQQQPPASSSTSDADDESMHNSCIEQGAPTPNEIINDADWDWSHKQNSSSKVERRMKEETARIENLSMPTRANCNRNDDDHGIYSTGRTSISFASNVNIPINEDETAIMYPDEKEEKIGLLPDDDEEDNGGDYDLPFDSFSSKLFIEFLLPTYLSTILFCYNKFLSPFFTFPVLFVAKWDKNDVVRSLKQYLFPISVFFMQMLIMVMLMINLLQSSDRQLLTTMNVPVSIILDMQTTKKKKISNGVITQF